MLKKLMLLFIAMVVTTTIAETYLIAGTWEYLLMQSLSLSIIIFFIYNFVVFQLQHKESEQKESKYVVKRTHSECYQKQTLRKIK
ncbi:hypothetical protein [Staphylococcus canis]|uniref:Uncharacterized protein n=1 Tax=Staphylococcus canis TaxID=2724942 RepID=A0ABS0T9B0_9STAP|nr:hypothetical protein [Staphylococcus canis]MBI5974353.1 hypothetical protein [Staphylococcus canis]